MKNILVKISSRSALIIFTGVIYLIFLIFNPRIFYGALNRFIGMAGNIWPVLLLVLVLMFFFNLLLDSQKIMEKISKNTGIKGYLLSIILGIISAGPIYAWYPLLSDLKGKGLKDSLIVTFLYNRAVKLPLIPVMIYYFGVKFVLTLTVLMITFSVINGILAEKIINNKFLSPKK
jgi:uncharacterized membrane protein YraQ (UPF0718 family)